MKKYTILLLLAIFPAFGDISQDTWWLAHKKNDSVAQYAVALAYSPDVIDNEDRWRCDEGKFYLYLRDKPGQCKLKSAEKYIEWLTKSANNGYPLAQTQLGIDFLQGKIIDKNITQAIYWLEKAAGPVPKNVSFSVGEGTLWLRDNRENGVGEAQYYLATIYADGLNGKADYNKAAYYYQKASNSDDWGYTGRAQHQLAKLYKDKINDPQKALFWLEQTALKASVDRDNKEILYIPLTVVNHYLSGGQSDGTVTENIDYQYAASRLLRMVNKSNLLDAERVKANFLLAWLYLTGKGVAQEPATAAHYYINGLKLLSEKSARSPFNLTGDLQQNALLNTIIIPAYRDEMDMEQALSVLSTIFSDSPQQEQQFLAALMALSDKANLHPNQASVFKLRFALLAKNRNFAVGYTVTAQLGELLYLDPFAHKGENFASDLENLYLTALALQPDEPQVLYGLAVVNEFMLDDENKAFTYYQKASELAHKEASYRLGVLYYLGKGVEQDYKKAWQLLNASAKLGFKAASNFSLSISATHPDADWLKEQYLTADQSYSTPAVRVDGIDWLESQVEQTASPMLNYHHFRRQSTSDEFDSYQYCRAAKLYADAGDIATQQRFLALVKQGVSSCKPSDEQLAAWLDNSEASELDKRYLTALLYGLTGRKEQQNKLMHKLMQQEYADAYVYLADQLDRDKLSHQPLIKMYLASALKQGNAQAAELFISYYDKPHWSDKNSTYDPYQYQKFILIRNDLTNFYLADRLYSYMRIEQRKYVYNLTLSQAEIFKMWHEIAQMHELGEQLPKNLTLAYVWYCLLDDYNQPTVKEKIASLKVLLSVEQLQNAEAILARHRDVYRFYLI